MYLNTHCFSGGCFRVHCARLPQEVFMRDAREVAALLVAREDEEARLKRIAAKSKVIEMILSSVREARDKGEGAAVVRMRDDYDCDHEAAQTAGAVLRELGLSFTKERGAHSWGIRDLNTGYTVTLTIEVPKE